MQGKKEVQKTPSGCALRLNSRSCTMLLKSWAAAQALARRGARLCALVVSLLVPTTRKILSFCKLLRPYHILTGEHRHEGGDCEPSSISARALGKLSTVRRCAHSADGSL